MKTSGCRSWGAELCGCRALGDCKAHELWDVGRGFMGGVSEEPPPPPPPPTSVCPRPGWVGAVDSGSQFRPLGMGGGRCRVFLNNSAPPGGEGWGV